MITASLQSRLYVWLCALSCQYVPGQVGKIKEPEYRCEVSATLPIRFWNYIAAALNIQTLTSFATINLHVKMAFWSSRRHRTFDLGPAFWDAGIVNCLIAPNTHISFSLILGMAVLEQVGAGCSESLGWPLVKPAVHALP